MPEEIAIKVDKVSKDFVLPHDRVDSVKGMVTSLTKGRAWKTKGTQHALRNISFEVKKGEFFGIVGRNGSGKSTMLKILAGIYQPTSGKVSVSGKLVPFIELGVGFNGELTGRENVYLNGAMLGFSRKQIDEMYDEIVSFAELESFMDQKLKNYSSGMQVRLAFSMATRAKAEVLLVDEVLAVGDADFQHKCFDYFRKLKRDKKTVIFVSHDMNSVREYCDRAILIEKSKMILEGTADEVASKYTQIFLDEAKTAQETGTSKRWGDGAVTYDDLKFEYADKERRTISILATATAHREVHNPNFGFLVRSADGTAILGTNSHNKRQMVKRLIPGQQVTISWQFDNILNSGTHFVEPAIVYEGNITAEWWEEARKLTVRKAEPTPYPVNPDVTLDMSISGGGAKEKVT